MQPGPLITAATCDLPGLTAIAFMTRKDFSFLGALLKWGMLCALMAIGGGEHVHTRALQDLFGEFPHAFIVVDYERGAAQLETMAGFRRRFGLYGRTFDRREHHLEAGPQAQFTRDFDSASVPALDSRDCGEPETPAGKLRGKEGIEDSVQRLLVHATASIPNREDNVS